MSGILQVFLYFFGRRGLKYVSFEEFCFMSTQLLSTQGWPQEGHEKLCGFKEDCSCAFLSLDISVDGCVVFRKREYSGSLNEDICHKYVLME
jgi:hypothetical protein